MTASLIATPVASLIAAPAPYPSASGAQACADWCASALAAHASSIVAANAWMLQRQWQIAGAGLASYPLPFASGPAPALQISGAASSCASMPLSPSVTFIGMPTPVASMPFATS